MGFFGSFQIQSSMCPNVELGKLSLLLLKSLLLWLFCFCFTISLFCPVQERYICYPSPSSRKDITTSALLNPSSLVKRRGGKAEFCQTKVSERESRTQQIVNNLNTEGQSLIWYKHVPFYSAHTGLSPSHLVTTLK